MQLQSKKKAIPQPRIICNSETSPDRPHPRPPTPPRPSQRRLEEEGKAHWDSSQVDDGELEEGTADDCTEGEDSPRSTQLYTQEELVILTRKIFGDEDEEEDGEFWDADSGPWAAVSHPAKDERANVDHQDQESDTGGQPGEREGKATESKLDGLFGPTSNVCLSTPSQDGLPRSPQDDDDDQDIEVVQDVLEAAANSATVDTSDGLNSSTDDTPLTTTTSTPLTSPEYPHTALHLSPSRQHPPLLDNGFAILSTIDDALIGNLQPGESLEAHVGANDDLFGPVPVPTTQTDPPEELEPCKPAVVIPSEEEPHCNTIRRIIRKKGLPDFSPTRPGIFSAVIISRSDDAPLGKRKRSREDDGDGDEGERAFSPTSVSHQVPRPR